MVLLRNVCIESAMGYKKRHWCTRDSTWIGLAEYDDVEWWSYISGC